MDYTSSNPFTSVGLDIDYTGLDTSISSVTSVNSSLTPVSTPFDWNSFGASLANTAASLFTAFAKVQIAGQAQQYAYPGQVIGGQVAVSSAQAEQSKNTMMAVGIIGAVTLVTVLILNK